VSLAQLALFMSESDYGQKKEYRIRAVIDGSRSQRRSTRTKARDVKYYTVSDIYLHFRIIMQR
jgi:hypothetical protein